MDRADELAVFDSMLVSHGGPPHVLNMTGVGGIGKSRIISEMRHRAAESNRHTAVLDLQVPNQRHHENALAVLRTQYGEYKRQFHRFDIAYAVLWQRLHPQLRLTAEGIAFADKSEILTSILDEASGVPVFGTAMKLVESAARRLRRWNAVRSDSTLLELDLLDLQELTDAVTYLFAADLNSSTKDADKYTLFIDAYDALAVSHGKTLARHDAWIRDLVSQLKNGIVVIASREPLQWDHHHPEWARLVRLLRVPDLPMWARRELLEAIGVRDGRLAESIAVGSGGLPFYLHLAVDTGSSTGSVVSPDAILERFLRNVDPTETRLLELMSVARSFDREIFALVGQTQGIEASNLRWDSITSYSFVSTAGQDALTVHQLMLTTLRNRLEPSVRKQVHALLHRHRVERTKRHDAQGARNLREAAYHGLHAGELSAVNLLEFADKLRVLGGRSGVEGLEADLAEFLASTDRTHPDIQLLARYLATENALLVGDSVRAAELTANVPEPAEQLGELSARLNVAAAQARRIKGETRAALRRFEAIHRHADGMTRLMAGIWASDLHMAQGRFAEALDTAQQLLGECPAEWHELLGDIERLIHLAYRFSFDFTSSEIHLAKAAGHYADAASIVGTANVSTNRVETLCLTDAEAAIRAADAALEQQRELGAQHEVGKIYSALGLAHLVLGHLSESDCALDRACALLERARYRSGRARAELYRAALRARQGRFTAAAGAVRTAVEELTATEVYPTLILTAADLLNRIGRPEKGVTEAASKAASRVTLPAGASDLGERIKSTLDRLLGNTLIEIYETAVRRSEHESGFYNRNLRVADRLVRIPIEQADSMDLAIWPESAVLATVNRYVEETPKLLGVSTSPPFQVHEFVDGEVLDRTFPRGTPLPDGLVEQLVAFFARLRAVPGHELPALPGDWPEDGDTNAFAILLHSVTERVHRQNHSRFGSLWTDLEFPERPLTELYRHRFSPRSFQLVHADVHRKNILVRAGRCVVIDWELALWADPLYDLATHLHKMAYQSHEEALVRARWATTMPAAATPGWEVDLEAYLRHERVKSAVVDSIRYAKLLAGPDVDARFATQLTGKLAAKVRAAQRVWQRSNLVGDADVARALRAWLDKQV